MMVGIPSFFYFLKKFDEIFKKGGHNGERY